MPDLTHLQRIRQEMPATTSHIYLNTGTFGPLPACVIQAMQERLDSEWRNGRLGAAAFESMGAIYQEARTKVAQLLNAREDEIALTDNTGEGLNIISFGIDWHAGDEVITTNHEHISLLAPLYQLRDRFGIVIRFADLGPNADRPILEAISDLVTPRTRLISISHVTWTTGALLDIQEVGRMGHEMGIPVLIDGAQSAGAIPIDVKMLGIDFYAIPMQKWLCGPDGTGALYVRKESLHYVRPTYVGPWSIKHEEGIEWELLENARCLEAGGRQTASLAGQVAVLNWLENTVGYDWLFERISSLNMYVYNALKTIPGLTVLTPKLGASGLTSFRMEGKNPTEVVNYLRENRDIHIRNIPSMDSLRISTGFYNTQDEIDLLVKVLQDFV